MKTAKKAQTRKAQPKKVQPEVTPIPKRARGASKLAEAQARRPVPQPPVEAKGKLEVFDTLMAPIVGKGKSNGKRVSGPAIPVVDEVAKMSKVDRLAAGKAEHASMKVWADKGKKGDAPATPVLDWLAENPSGSVQRRSQIRKANKSTNGSSPRVTCTVRFFANDREMGEASQSLSSVAYQHTAGIDKDSPKRISTEALRTLLAGVQVSDPETTEWEVTLSNGRKLSAKLA